MGCGIPDDRYGIRDVESGISNNDLPSPGPINSSFPLPVRQAGQGGVLIPDLVGERWGGSVLCHMGGPVLRFIESLLHSNYELFMQRVQWAWHAMPLHPYTLYHITHSF